VLAARAFDMRRAAGWFVVGVGSGDAAEPRRTIAGLEVLELPAVEPDTEAHPTKVKPDAAAAFLAHLTGTARLSQRSAAFQPCRWNRK